MAKAKTYSTRELSGKRVVDGSDNDKRVGKVDRFVFHPTAKRCVGFTVKRPDLALMFKRKDLFVPLDGFEVEDGRVVLSGEKEDSGAAAIKRLGLDWDACVLWEHMPMISESGDELGHVGDVVFSRATGKVLSVEASGSEAKKVLLGERRIPAKEILGFRTGAGVALAEMGAVAREGEEEAALGAIVVADESLSRESEGGLAERAGQQSAVVQDKIRRKVKPAASAAAKKAGDAIGKGAFATGRQLGRAGSMFSEFKKEFDKASGKDASKRNK